MLRWKSQAAFAHVLWYVSLHLPDAYDILTLVLRVGFHQRLSALMCLPSPPRLVTNRSGAGPLRPRRYATASSPCIARRSPCSTRTGYNITAQAYVPVTRRIIGVFSTHVYHVLRRRKHIIYTRT